MADTLALEKLYNDVVALWAAEAVLPAVPVLNLFGWRTPADKLNTGTPAGTRICWVPGDPSGALGELGPAAQPGRNPRSLATLGELFTCLISASDQTAPESELAQYKAARFLFDAWWRAVHKSMPGRVRLVALAWVIDAKERRFGATIRAVCAVEAMVPDVAFKTMPTSAAQAVITTELVGTGTTETDTVTNPP